MEVEGVKNVLVHPQDGMKTKIKKVPYVPKIK